MSQENKTGPAATAEPVPMRETPTPRHSVPRPTGCAFGCPIGFHEAACVLADLADRRPVDYSVSAAFVLRDGRPVLVSLAEYNAIHDGVPSIPRQRAA